MPIQSKYSTQQIEQLMEQVLDTLRQHNATTELSLMCLGNCISHIIRTQVPATHQEDVSRQFGQALLDALASKAS